MTTGLADSAPVAREQVPSAVPQWGVIARTTLAVLVLVGLTSAPSMSLWRWVTGSYNDVHSWPYRATVWAPLAGGCVMLAVDVIRPYGGERHRLASQQMVAAIAAGGLATWMIVSVAWSGDPRHSAIHVGLAVMLLANAAWFGLALSTPQQVLALFIATQVATVGSLFAVMVTPSARYSAYIGDHSWIGLFGNPNAMGPVACFAAMATAAAWRVVGTRAWRTGVLGALLGVDALVAVHATSYTAWLALVGGTLVWSTTALVKRLGTRHGPGRARAVAVAASIMIASAPFVIRVVASWFGKDSTLGGRTVAWRYALEATSERPLTGFGFSAFWHDPVNQFDYVTTSGRDWIASSHSTFVDAYLDLGVLGASLVAMIAVTSVGSTIAAGCTRASWTYRFWAAVGTFALVENLAESMMMMHSIFWLLLVVPGFAAFGDVADSAPSGHANRAWSTTG